MKHEHNVIRWPQHILWSSRCGPFLVTLNKLTDFEKEINRELSENTSSNISIQNKMANTFNHKMNHVKCNFP
jgi:hypothetical protein